MHDSFEVSVTQHDIQHGKRYDPRDCPIALGAKRAAPGYTVFATPAILILRRQGFPDEWYQLPDAAEEFQERFDNAPWDDFEVNLDPFTFTVTRVQLKKKFAT